MRWIFLSLVGSRISITKGLGECAENFLRVSSGTWILGTSDNKKTKQGGV